MKIYFASGKVECANMTEKECTQMTARMMGSGVRFYDMRDGRWIPLNSNTIELIDFEIRGLKSKSPVKEDPFSQDAIEGRQTVSLSAPVPDYVNPQATFEAEQAAAPPTREEKAKDILAEIIDRSNCKHEQEKLCLMTVGSKKGQKFFYTCSYCGWRGRWVKAENLSEEEKANAKTHLEK
jgi:hypothetical protein